MNVQYMKSVAAGVLAVACSIGLEIVPQMPPKRAPGGSEGEAGGSSGRPTASYVRVRPWEVVKTGDT